MQTSITERVASNKHLASTLRSRLKNGYPPASTFAKLVDVLSDEEIIENYLAHQKQ